MPGRSGDNQHSSHRFIIGKTAGETNRPKGWMKKDLHHPPRAGISGKRLKGDEESLFN